MELGGASEQDRDGQRERERDRERETERQRDLERERQREMRVLWWLVPVLHETDLPLARGVLDQLMRVACGAGGARHHHALGQTGGGSLELVGRHVTGGSWETDTHTGQRRSVNTQ